MSPKRQKSTNKPAFHSRLLAYAIQSLHLRTDSLSRFCIQASLLALLSSTIILAITLGAFLILKIDIVSNSPQQGTITWREYSSAVFIDPFFETILIIIGTTVLRLLKIPFFVIAAAIAAIFAFIHAAFAPLWFFGVICSFYVYCYGYMIWRTKSIASGFIAAFVPHAIVNATALSFACLTTFF